MCGWSFYSHVYILGEQRYNVFLNLEPDSERLASQYSLLAISKVHLLNKWLDGSLEMVANRKINASARNQILVFNHRTVTLANHVCKCRGFTGVVVVLDFRVIYVNELIMLLKVLLGWTGTLLSVTCACNVIFIREDMVYTSAWLSWHSFNERYLSLLATKLPQ